MWFSDRRKVALIETVTQSSYCVDWHITIDALTPNELVSTDSIAFCTYIYIYIYTVTSSPHSSVSDVWADVRLCSHSNIRFVSTVRMHDRGPVSLVSIQPMDNSGVAGRSGKRAPFVLCFSKYVCGTRLDCLPWASILDPKPMASISPLTFLTNPLVPPQRITGH